MIDQNADVGEGIGEAHAAIAPLDSAAIGCRGHADEPAMMPGTVAARLT